MNIDTGYSSNIALTFDASRVANELREALNCGEDSYKVLTEFHERMADHQQESFVVLEIIDLGIITDAFAWWLDDQSILIMGWKDDETMVLGVLPAGAELIPIPYYGAGLHPLH